MAKKTWEVRNMDEVDTADAAAAAKRAHQTVGEWLTDAIREKIARERMDIGEVMAPETAEPWSPLALIQTLEAYEHVMRLRGKPLSPRSRVLIAAERTLHARLLPAVGRPVLTHRPDSPDTPSRQAPVLTHRPDSPDAPSRQAPVLTHRPDSPDAPSRHGNADIA